MFIVIYEKLTGRNGGEDERPLALFRNPNEARVFLDMLAQGGRRAYARTV